MIINLIRSYQLIKVTAEPDVISHPPKGIYSPGDFFKKSTEETQFHLQNTETRKKTIEEIK